MAILNDLAPAGCQKSFRVIIAGGGIGGLAFSLAFQKIGIDHVLLEKGDIAPPWGASISLWAQGSRILQQLDCLDALQESSLPLKNMVTRTKYGKAFAEANLFELISQR
jgi:FAD dependent monooxygenase